MIDGANTQDHFPILRPNLDTNQIKAFEDFNADVVEF